MFPGCSSGLTPRSTTLVLGLVPVNPSDPTANRATAEQIAVGTLVVLNALARLVTAWLLLKIRHRGPGIWWSALVVTLAFGVVFHPAYGIMMGGIAGPGSISPRTWGLLLFAFEMYVLFQAFFLGRGWALWLLIPTFLLWANIDQSFLTGLIVLAAAAVGFWLDRKHIGRARRYAGESPTRKPARVGRRRLRLHDRLTSPGDARSSFWSLVRGRLAWSTRSRTTLTQSAFHPYLQLSEPAGKDHDGRPALVFRAVDPRALRAASGICCRRFTSSSCAWDSARSFLNARRFSWSRFLPFLVMSVIWGIFMNASPMFAVVFAAVVGPNGQEWYHDRVGTEGRLGRLWTVWSTGGRLVTLALIFLMIWIDITGWKNTLNEVQFGLGYNPDEFAFEAAEFLESSNEIKGNILNTSMPQGDVLIWKGAPKRKSYIDGRTRFFPAELLEQWEKTRKAISTDDIEAWKPLLDKYQISAIMIETGASPATYRAADAKPELGAVLRRRPDRDVRPRGCPGVGPCLFQGEPPRSRAAGVPHEPSGARGRAAAQPVHDDRQHFPEPHL